MGSFVSKPLGRAVGGREVVQGAFDTLADIIAKFPNQAQNAKFLFVPGKHLFVDAGLTSIRFGQPSCLALKNNTI